MINSRKPPLIFENVPILDIGSEGKAIARVNDLVVFVPWVVPGDVVDIQVNKRKRRHVEGKAIRFHHYSDKRDAAFCPHFGVCGGCRWQCMKYAEQLFYKQKQVADAFQRIGKLEFPPVLPIIPSEMTKFYRNKLEYSFSNRRWLEDISGDPLPEEADLRGLGFHLPQIYDKVLNIEACYLQAEPSDSIRKSVHRFAIENGYSYYDARKNEGLLRNLIIRNSNKGDLMLIFVFGYREEKKIRKILDQTLGSFPAITSIYYVINGKKNDSLYDLHAEKWFGKTYMEEAMEDLDLFAGPLSFSQVNTPQSIRMYSITKEWAQLTGREIVYDLYSGAGSIANFIARRAYKVIGLEYVAAAVSDARLNSDMNGITNTLFFAGDVADTMTDGFFEAQGIPDVIITDPPRAGMHLKVIRQMLRAAPQRIIYISCNPATQARDLALMAENYQISKVQPVDMFPQTHHVENIALLERRS